MKKLAIALLILMGFALPACGGDPKDNSSNTQTQSSVSVSVSSGKEEQGDGSSIQSSQKPVTSEQDEGVSTGDNSSSEESSSAEDTSSETEDTSSDEQKPPKPDLEECTDGHTDDNEDGKCDTCEISVTYTLDFFALNDLHGKFADTDAQVGVDELTTYLKQAKAENPYTVILSSGDMWQGSPESNLTKGAIITEWMNDVGFVSMSMGNHEYDWGQTYIDANDALANFPFLGINVYDAATNTRKPYCQPSVTVEFGEVKIGVIGAIGDCLSSISGEMSSGLDFKTGAELSALVKAEAIRLRNEEGVDFIVYSVHGDYEEYDEELSNGYVDLVFEGHSHSSYREVDGYGVYHLQNGGDNNVGISHAEVSLNYVTGRIQVLNASVVSKSEYTHLADAPIVDTLMQKYDESIQLQYKELGANEKYREGGEILDDCAKLYFEAGNERWGEKYDLVLGGGYMSIRSPGALNAGTITYGELMNILPFDNQLVLCSVKGSDLRNFNASKKNYHIYYSTYGNSILNSIEDDKTYYLVTDTYSSTHKPNNLTEIERYGDGIYARDLLAAYIEEGGYGGLVSAIRSITVAEALAIGNALSDNQTTTEKFIVQGKILNIEPIHQTGTHYGNMTIQDLNGDEIYVYGTFDSDGNRYGEMEIKPQVGEWITLETPIQKYVNKAGETKIELYQATIRSFVALTSIPDILTVGSGLAHNQETSEVYYTVGTVSEVVAGDTRGLFYIQDENSNTLYVYRVYDEAGNGYTAMRNPPKVGDKVLLKAVIKKYNQTIELFDAILIQSI